MRIIDEAFMEMPWYGSRQMARHLRRQGWYVGRKRVRRLMRKIGLSPIYQAPKTSEPHPQHRIYPYLLRHLAIERPDQVWYADVTYILMRRGLLRLGRCHGLVQPKGFDLAAFEHDECRLLCYSRRRCDSLPRQARRLQHRSGKPVHQLRLHDDTEGRWNPHFHGWTRPLDG